MWVANIYIIPLLSWKYKYKYNWDHGKMLESMLKIETKTSRHFKYPKVT